MHLIIIIIIVKVCPVTINELKRQHLTYMLNKVGKRMFCIHYLARAGISEADIVHVYCSIIHSVLEYACPVWHPVLTKVQSKEIERVQKRCLRVIYPSFNYSEALNISGLETLTARRDDITCKLFCEIKDEGHVLHSLLPKRELKSNYHSEFLPLHNSYHQGNHIRS